MKRYCIFLPFIILSVMGALNSCAPEFMVVSTPAEMPPPRKFDSPPRVALVLGGGAFKGIAHAGVLKVFEEEKIPIDVIIGASSGSLVGGLYAAKPYADSLYPLIISSTRHDFFDISLFHHRSGYVKGKKLQAFMKMHAGDISIEQTRIPFIAVVTDLMNQLTVPLSSGPLAASVNASCAIPIIFRPVLMYGTMYVDGGVLDVVPVDVAASLGPQVIIAVDVSATEDSVVTIRNREDIAMRSISTAGRVLKEQELGLADVVIAPALPSISVLDDSRNQEIYQAGMDAARAAIPAIREVLIRKNIIR